MPSALFQLLREEGALNGDLWCVTTVGEEGPRIGRGVSENVQVCLNRGNKSASKISLPFGAIIGILALAC